MWGEVCAGYGLEGPPCSTCPGDERCASIAAFWKRYPQYDPRLKSCSEYPHSTEDQDADTD